VYGIDNDFEEPIIMGTWNKIKKWFLSWWKTKARGNKNLRAL
jgi:hypothetical protein